MSDRKSMADREDDEDEDEGRSRLRPESTESKMDSRSSSLLYERSALTIDTWDDSYCVYQTIRNDSRTYALRFGSHSRAENEVFIPLK